MESLNITSGVVEVRVVNVAENKQEVVQEDVLTQLQAALARPGLPIRPLLAASLKGKVSARPRRLLFLPNMPIMGVTPPSWSSEEQEYITDTFSFMKTRNRGNASHWTQPQALRKKHKLKN